MSWVAEINPPFLPLSQDVRGERSILLALRAIRVITHRELVKHFRDAVRLLSDIAQLGVFLVIFGYGLSALVPSGAVGGGSFPAYIFPGILAINVVTTPVLKAISLTTDREAGFISELLVTPVPRHAIALGKVMATTLVTTVQAAALLAAAPLVGIRLSAASVLLTLLAIALSAFCFASLGIALAAYVTRTSAFQGIVQAVLFPLMFLSGSVFPPNAVPGVLAAVVRINPVSYAVDLIRRTLIGPDVVTLSLPGMHPVPVVLEMGVLALSGLSLTWAAARRLGRSA
jgi:ABC-2 type transport system permease protein